MEQGCLINPFQRALIEKLAVGRGSNKPIADEQDATLASARHPTRSISSVLDAGFGAYFTSGFAAQLSGLWHGFSKLCGSRASSCWAMGLHSLLCCAKRQVCLALCPLKPQRVDHLLCM